MAAGNSAPYATNAFGVNVAPLDYTAPGAPTTMTYHGCAIVCNGNIVGRVQSWQVSGAKNREATHVYELNSNTWGKPVDLVPGKTTGYTIAMAHIEMWNAELELAFGYPAVFADLSDQDRPFTLLEYLFKGQTLYRAWNYLACWLTAMNNEQYTAEGDAKITCTADITYVTRKRVV